MHRRPFVTSAALAGAIAPILATSTRARQPGTPVATPVVPEGGTAFGASLAERVAQIEPAELLRALRTLPVTSTLLPADTPPVVPEVWHDSDTDLDGTLGGVVFNTGFDALNNFQGIGVAIVHPDAASAENAVVMNDQDRPAESSGTLVGGLRFFYQEFDDAVALMQLDCLLMAGNAPLGDVDDVDEANQPALVLSATSHLVALLDHLDTVLTGLGA